MSLDLELEIEAIIPKLDRLRSLIVYDSQYVMRSLLFRWILPHFSSKKLFIAVYTDSMTRRLHITYQSLPEEISALLSRANVIKVGMHDEVPFGKLHAFIDVRSNWFGEFISVLDELEGSSLLIFHGFSLLPMVYGEKAWEHIMEIIDALPNDITFVNKVSSSLYSDEMRRFMERFHDVVIRIRREEDFLVGNTYWIGVDQSITFDITPGYARYRIENGELVRV
jgi:hypothetical protein